MASYLQARTDMSDMNMGDTATSSASGMMKQYFHGTLNDTLWFTSWTPTTGGGFAGACIVLFFLAVVDRFLHAVRGSAEVRWRATVQSILLPSSSTSNSNQPRPSPTQNQSSSSSSSISSTQNEKPLPPSSQSKDVDDPSSSSSISPVPTLPSNPPSSQADRRNRDPLPAVLDLLPGRRARWAPPFVWKIDVVRGAMQAVQLGVHYLLMLAVMTFNVYFFIVILAGAAIGETMFGRFGAAGGHH